MALTQTELNEILTALKAASQDVTELDVATSLTGVNSLPALQGNTMVSVPLTMLSQLLTQIAINEATSATSIANTAKTTANEAKAAADSAPLSSLIQAATAAGAVYNETTGYFELNTLTDITAEQMRRILYSPDCHIGGAWQVAKNIRTNLTLDNPTLGWTGNEAKSLEFIVYCNNTIEVLKLTRSDGNIWVNKLFHAFRGAPKLRVIIGQIQSFTAINAELAFASCPALEEVRIGRFYSNLDFSDCPKLSLASLTHMVQHGAPDLTPTKSITYTLHPEAYARLTPALISEAAAKYISFATKTNV